MCSMEGSTLVPVIDTRFYCVYVLAQFASIQCTWLLGSCGRVFSRTVSLSCCSLDVIKVLRVAQDSIMVDYYNPGN